MFTYLLFTPSRRQTSNKLWFSELTKSTAAPQTDTHKDRLTKHCSNEQQFPWQLWGKAGEAVTGWQAGSGRTISEGLKGFPWPLMPPEILKPRPGFFSILTHNWRKKRKTKQNRQKKIKEKQVKVKCTDQNNLYVSIERTACTHGSHAFMCRGTRFGSYVGGLQFRTSDRITVNTVYCCSQISGCLCLSGHRKLYVTLHFNNHNHKVAEKSSINEIWTEQ